jgi:transposase
MLAPIPIAGIDVGKTFLDLGFDPAAGPLRFRNDAAGVAALIEALRRRNAARVALEAIVPSILPSLGNVQGLSHICRARRLLSG